MTKIFRTFSMDFTSEREHAQRADGQWFSRYQYRDPRYGYKWSRWQVSGFLPSTASLKTEKKVRLPR